MTPVNMDTQKIRGVVLQTRNILNGESRNDETNYYIFNILLEVVFNSFLLHIYITQTSDDLLQIGPLIRTIFSEM